MFRATGPSWDGSTTAARQQWVLLSGPLRVLLRVLGPAETSHICLIFDFRALGTLGCAPGEGKSSRLAPWEKPNEVPLVTCVLSVSVLVLDGQTLPLDDCQGTHT